MMASFTRIFSSSIIKRWAVYFFVPSSPNCHVSRIVFLMLLGSISAVSWSQPYQVGFRNITYNDPSRNNRAIPCDVYYPANTAGSNVGLAEGVFPHVVFGHGFLMVPSAYNIIADALATAGMIVLLPSTEGGIGPSHTAFGRDLAFVADQVIANGAVPGNFFFQAVAGKFAIGGHSMGGGCTYLSDQFLVNAPTTFFTFAAAETSPSAISAMGSITAPNLLIAGGLDCVTPPNTNQIPMYQAQTSSLCKTYIEIEGGYHCQFNSSNFFCNFGENSCAPSGGINLQSQIDITMSLLLPWLNYWLKDDCSSWVHLQEIINNASGFTSDQVCGVEVPDSPAITINGTLPACPGATVILTAAVIDGSVVWNTGSPDLSIQVSQAGSYSYQLMVDGCTVSSEVVEVIFAEEIFPMVVSEGGLQLCEDEFLLLRAQPASGLIIWNNGMTGPEILVTEAGVYSFELTMDGCTFESNTIELTLGVDPLATVEAQNGNVLCEGGALWLSPSGPYSDVIWSNGVSSFFLEVTLPGTYSYEYTWNGCRYFSNSLEVIEETINSLTVLFEGGLNICLGRSIQLSASQATGGSIIWSNGISAPTIEVTEIGNYSYQLITDNCTFSSDTVNVSAIEIEGLGVQIDGSLALCPGGSRLLTATYDGSDLVWNNGSTEPTILIETAGAYFYLIDTLDCLFSSDTITLNMVENPELKVLLEGNTTFCEGEELLLSASDLSFLPTWSNGSQGNSIVVNESGAYSFFYDVSECLFFSDTLTITRVDQPIYELQIDGDTTACAGDTITLLILSEEDLNVNWQPNFEPGPLALVTSSGQYAFYILFEECIFTGDTFSVLFYDNWLVDEISGPDIVALGERYDYEVLIEDEFHTGDLTRFQNQDFLFQWEVEGATIVEGQNTSKVTLETPLTGDNGVQITVYIDDLVCKDTLLMKSATIEKSSSTSNPYNYIQTFLAYAPNSWLIDIYGGVGNMDIAVYSTAGQHLGSYQAMGSGQLAIEHGLYPPGMYLISISHNGELVKVFKAIK